MTDTVLIGGFIVLIALVLWVTFAICRIVWAIIVGLRKNRVPKATTQVVGLGEMEYWPDSDTWITTTATPAIILSGDAQGPTRQALKRYVELRALLPQKTAAAVDCIIAQEPTATRTGLELSCIEIDDEDDFTLEFTMEGDADGGWRVDFKKGEPVFFGRDD